MSIDCLEVLDLVNDLVLEGHAVDGILLLELVQVVKLSSTSRKVDLVRVDQLGLVDDCTVENKARQSEEDTGGQRGRERKRTLVTEVSDDVDGDS